VATEDVDVPYFPTIRRRPGRSGLVNPVQEQVSDLVSLRSLSSGRESAGPGLCLRGRICLAPWIYPLPVVVGQLEDRH
jgi:hypothetical protein